MLRFFFACCLLRKISEVEWHAIPFTQIIYKFPEVFCDLDRSFCFLINQMICWFQFRKRVIWTLWKVSYPSIFRNDIIQAATSDAKNGIVSGAPQQWIAGPGSTWKKDLQSTAFFWCFLLVISHEKTQRACHGCDLFASKKRHQSTSSFTGFQKPSLMGLRWQCSAWPAISWVCHDLFVCRTIIL